MRRCCPHGHDGGDASKARAGNAAASQRCIRRKTVPLQIAGPTRPNERKLQRAAHAVGGEIEAVSPSLAKLFSIRSEPDPCAGRPTWPPSSPTMSVSSALAGRPVPRLRAQLTAETPRCARDYLTAL